MRILKYHEFCALVWKHAQKLWDTSYGRLRRFFVNKNNKRYCVQNFLRNIDINDFCGIGGPGVRKSFTLLSLVSPSPACLVHSQHLEPLFGSVAKQKVIHIGVLCLIYQNSLRFHLFPEMRNSRINQTYRPTMNGRSYREFFYSTYITWTRLSIFFCWLNSY